MWISSWKTDADLELEGRQVDERNMFRQALVKVSYNLTDEEDALV